MHINTSTLLLTGTNFGLLNSYPKANYFDGYLFTDFLGNGDINYALTLSGGSFIEEFKEEEIPTDGMLFWLDSSDVSTLTYNESGNIMSMKDKSGTLDLSGNEKVFISYNSQANILTGYWPVYSTGAFTTEQEILSNFRTVSASTLICARFLQNSYLGCSGFTLNFNSEPFTLFLVWKDNNTQYRSIPFSIKTKTESLTSEFVAHINHNVGPVDLISWNPPIAWGTRGTGSILPGELPIGFMVNYLSSADLFNDPNITYFNSPSGTEDFSLYVIESDNTKILPDFSYFHSYYINTPYNTIGYLDDDNFNDFYFGEMLVYNRKLSKIEQDKIFNTLSKKWHLKDITRDNTSFSEEISGGILKNKFYEDFVLAESVFDIPIQECTTMLTLVLSSFDETVSEISKVVCMYKDLVYKIETPINIDPLSATKIKTLRKIDILLNPDSTLHKSTYSVYLSVYKFDSTVNKIKLTGDILKCGINNFYNNSYLIDSQLSNDSNKVFIVNEDRTNKQLYINTLNVQTPNQVLSGGDVVTLQNLEFVKELESVITLDELLGISTKETITYKRPIISPVTNPNINPVSPY